MSHTDEAAFQKITAAKYKMVSRQPFFASIALFLPFIEAPWLNPPTMATDMQNIYYHPQFVHDCSQHELIGVIAHETCHVAFLHGTRRHDREPRLWNIACDYAINPIILDAGMKLPGLGLYEDKYRNMTAQAIYADLQKNQDAIKKILDKMPIFQIGGNGEPQAGDGNPGDGDIIHGGIIDTSQFKDADGKQISATEIEHAIKMKVAGAAQAAKSIGKMPGGFEGLLEAVGKPVINWHEYIQAWVKGHTPDDFTWARPNRRMLANHRVYMPSMVLRGAGTGVLSIDTSGSVSDQELIKYITEIVGVIEMCKPEKLVIIQHDAIIQQIDEWDMSMDFSSLKVKGRGGTCIAPVFKHLREIDDEIDWMICFTDMGINDYPTVDKAPEYPVLWAATGPDNAPFGTYIPVKDAMDG